MNQKTAVCQNCKNQFTIECSSQKNGQTIEYPHGTTAFRITDAELGFYRKMNLPVPDKCSLCRRQDKMNLRNPHKLWHRACTCGGSTSDKGAYENQASHSHGAGHCPNEFETSYAPDRPEIVYCEQCYQAEVV